jgi:hypothetical protein
MSSSPSRLGNSRHQEHPGIAKSDSESVESRRPCSSASSEPKVEEVHYMSDVEAEDFMDIMDAETFFPMPANTGKPVTFAQRTLQGISQNQGKALSLVRHTLDATDSMLDVVTEAEFYNHRQKASARPAAVSSSSSSSSAWRGKKPEMFETNKQRPRRSARTRATTAKAEANLSADSDYHPSSDSDSDDVNEEKEEDKDYKYLGKRKYKKGPRVTTSQYQGVVSAKFVPCLYEIMFTTSFPVCSYHQEIATNNEKCY